MSPVSVRYIADDVESATAFYRDKLGFTVEMSPAPGFAMLSRGDLRLLLNAPGSGGAGQATPDGRLPEPGGWNRIQLEVADLANEVEALRQSGTRFPQRDRDRQGRQADPARGPVGEPDRAIRTRLIRRPP